MNARRSSTSAIAATFSLDAASLLILAMNALASSGNLTISSRNDQSGVTAHP